MTKKSNKKVIRKELEKGKFTTVHHSILYDKRLTPTAFRILVSILSDSDTKFNITQNLIVNRFGLHKNTVNAAFRNLEECGYLRRSALHKGHFYTISEYGNLKKVEDNHCLEESPSQPISSLPTIYEKIENYLKENVKLIVNEEFSEFIMRTINENENKDGTYDFSEIRKKLDKKKNALKKKEFKRMFKLTENLSKHYSKKAITVYKDWLNKELYENNTIPANYREKWLQIKRSHYSYKTDYETAARDQAEQDYYDNL